MGDLKDGYIPYRDWLKIKDKAFKLRWWKETEYGEKKPSFSLLKELVRLWNATKISN
jgi:hypothetical protein